MTRSRGFTLIELLVVIAIIALLAGVVAASVNQARVKARDIKRVQDMEQVANAIVLYAQDHQGDVPPSGGGTSFGCSVTTCAEALTDDLVPTYIGDIANDPKHGLGTNGYRYCRVSTNTQRYDIMIMTEFNAGASWCVIRHPNQPINNETGCSTYNNSIPAQGWCDQEI